MIVIAGLVIGAVSGALLARKHGGRWPDMLQYAAAMGIGLAVLGLVLTIVIERAVS